MTVSNAKELAREPQHAEESLQRSPGFIGTSGASRSLCETRGALRHANRRLMLRVGVLIYFLNED